MSDQGAVQGEASPAQQIEALLKERDRLAQALYEAERLGRARAFLRDEIDDLLQAELRRSEKRLSARLLWTIVPVLRRIRRHLLRRRAVLE